ncbi:hypothetical protein A8709_01805 [Paenibacillus pectinilyticus]|uniref:HTH tetR-type domain-containing protein n=1 Tax=Paenibacillus pectinilyticus TaxID=512399 RepID=A0A1C1A6L4_9BACL|nr:TetR/AcrR family transcriptional regulator [Paenibacillus pectinilyticus]OCT16201.1 hypothetical protein A8709_01805 [Paenibacillus pectinilyticus]
MSIRHERKDAMENRQRILQTANQLFDEYGVQSVSMHQIAKMAGIGQATLYRRYAHKGDLCYDVLQHYGTKFINEVTSYLESYRTSPPLERICWILDHWIDAIEEKAELIVGMASKMDLTCEDDRGNFFLSPMYRFIRDNMSALILEVVGTSQDKRSASDFDAHTLICSLSPIGYFYIKNEKAYTKVDMKEHYHRICSQLFQKNT